MALPPHLGGGATVPGANQALSRLGRGPGDFARSRRGSTLANGRQRLSRQSAQRQKLSRAQSPQRQQNGPAGCLVAGGGFASGRPAVESPAALGSADPAIAGVV